MDFEHLLFLFVLALGTLGFEDYKEEAVAVLHEAKAVAAKKRRGSTRLENLGIPEEELLRQQQELFEKVSGQWIHCYISVLVGVSLRGEESVAQ